MNTTENIECSLAHPQLYGLHTPYARQLRRFASDRGAAQYALSKSDVRLNHDHWMSQAVAFTLYENLAGIEKTTGLAGDDKRLTRWMGAEASTAQQYGWFCHHGRQIFDFSKDLSDAFSRSDLAETQCGDIRLPFEAFYLRFHLSAPLALYTGRTLDGCYVLHGKDWRNGSRFLHLALAPHRTGAWPDLGDKGVDTAIEMDRPEETIVRAIRRGEEEHVRMWEEGKREALRDAGLSEDIEAHSPQEEERGFSRPDVEAALNLVGNALLFLSAYPEAVIRQWPAGVPPDLLLQAQSGTLKQRRRAIDDLEETGYSQIHYCGYVRPGDTRDEQTGTGRTVSGHWRRGHWRRQPVGPRHKGRRLTWVRPCLVHGDLGNQTPGRVYEVRP